MGHSGLTDVVIAGGGIVGAACASEFAAAGLNVALVEHSVIGGAATATGMGHLAVMDDSDAQFALTRYSQLLWKSLAERLPPGAEYLPCGAIWIAADEEEMAEVYRKQRFYTERDTPVELLDSQSLVEAEPNLRAGLAGGLRLVDDGVVYPPYVSRFLIEESRAQLHLGRRIVKLSESGPTLDDGTFLPTAHTVLATGASACTLVPDLPISPRKGHLLITDRHPGFLRHQLIELGYLKSANSTDSDSVAFNAQPRLTGQVLIGSSRQYGVDDPAVESPMLDRMLLRAVEYLPDLASLSAIRTWTGFRAATPDKLPLIGVCPGYNNIYLATGHEGLGIATSMATARLLADLILDRESAISREPYQPERGYAHA
jgi:glycine/D-amino acid oxidase-like deaminating enzyme